MNQYPPIAEHGMVGDLQTAALVSCGGTVDWWCTPRFDSPSLFASLLDSERGGHCRLAVELPDDGMSVRQLYLSDTAILVTRFMAPGGVGEVADFMPPVESPVATDRHTLIRLIRVVRGSLPFAFDCRPRFDYGRVPHTLTRPGGHRAALRGPGIDLHVQTSDAIAMHTDGEDVTARFTLSAGQIAAVVLTSSAHDPDRLSTLDAMDEELVSDSLVYRYDPAASPDGLRGSEGTFNLCSFLYVEALARSGRPAKARYAFDKMLTYANHVGLFAEEIGPSGEQLGNFPQAFTHLALVTAAMALDEELGKEGADPRAADHLHATVHGMVIRRGRRL